MERTRQHFEQQQDGPRGIAGDLHRLKSEGGALAAELREFLSRLKSRSPQEVMGVVAESDLVRSTLTATGGCLVLLVVLTVVPYLLKPPAAAVTAKPAADSAEPADDEAPPAADNAAADTSQTAAPVSTEPDLENAARAMGIGETVEADPDVNPLDSKLDKLLDGIE